MLRLLGLFGVQLSTDELLVSISGSEEGDILSSSVNSTRRGTKYCQDGERERQTSKIPIDEWENFFWGNFLITFLQPSLLQLKKKFKKISLDHI